MLDSLFSWPVVGAALAILLGFGRTFMMTATNFSRICFTAAAFLLLAKFGTWVATIQYPMWQRIIATIFIFGLIGVGWAESWRFLDNQQSKHDEQVLQPYQTLIYRPLSLRWIVAGSPCRAFLSICLSGLLIILRIVGSI